METLISIDAQMTEHQNASIGKVVKDYSQRLGDFIRKNTVYPELAKEIGIEGTVYVSFIIDEKGQIESSKILKGIGGGCSEEATRVVNKNFHPGFLKSNPVCHHYLNRQQQRFATSPFYHQDLFLAV